MQRRKNQNRGKAASTSEIQETVSDYLKGDNVSSISQYLYRSPSFVKNILDRVGVPQRPPSAEDRMLPAFLPENCVAEEFEAGEIVWSAKYHSPAVIDRKHEDPLYLEKYGSNAYQIYIYEKDSNEDNYLAKAGKGGFYASCLAYDLGKLSHLAALGIDLKKELS